MKSTLILILHNCLLTNNTWLPQSKLIELARTSRQCLWSQHVLRHSCRGRNISRGGIGFALLLQVEQLLSLLSDLEFGLLLQSLDILHLADSYVGFLVAATWFFLDVVLAAHMLKQLTVSVELSLTVWHSACEWLQIIVPVYMILQVSAGCESDIAEVTGVRFLPCMCSLVHKQVWDTIKKSAAHFFIWVGNRILTLRLWNNFIFII